MVRLGVAASLALAVLDVALTDGLSVLFDTGFVLLCVALALLVRPSDFYTVGVLPPLLMLGLCLALGLVAPGAVADPADGMAQATVAGLAHHAGALATGYLLCLACLGQRQRILRIRAARVERAVR